MAVPREKWQVIFDFDCKLNVWLLQKGNTVLNAIHFEELWASIPKKTTGERTMERLLGVSGSSVVVLQREVKRKCRYKAVDPLEGMGMTYCICRRGLMRFAYTSGHITT